jgi:hypothetical protein
MYFQDAEPLLVIMSDSDWAGDEERENPQAAD